LVGVSDAALIEYRWLACDHDAAADAAQDARSDLVFWVGGQSVSDACKDSTNRSCAGILKTNALLHVPVKLILVSPVGILLVSSAKLLSVKGSACNKSGGQSDGECDRFHGHISQE